MATWIANGAPGTTTPGMPAGAASGDMIVVFAYRVASGTAPTLPASWTSSGMTFTGTAVNSMLVAYRIYDGVWTMPVFTNAARTDSICIRPAAAGASLAIGTTNGVHKSQSNVVWDTVTPVEPGNRSVILRGVAHTRPDGVSGSAFPLPTGHTLISQTGVQPGYGTWRKDTVTDMNTATSAISRSTTYVVGQAEVIDVVAVTQAAYAFYSDDGDLTTATIRGTQDTAPSIELGAGNVDLHLRVRLQSTNAAGTAPLDDWRLQYDKNASGSWTNVAAASTNVQYFASTNITDTGVINAARLTGGTGSFATGRCSEDAINDDLGWSGNNFTEVLYTIRLVAADLANGNTLTFRIQRNNATATMTYAATPTINVLKTPVAVTQAAYRFFNDDGSETTATAKAAQNTAPSINLNGAPAVIPIRVRVLLQSTTATTVASTDDWLLQVEKNANGTWRDIGTAGSDTFTVDSTFLTDLQATTSRLTGGTGGFTPGKVRDTQATVTDVGWAGNGFTELEWSVGLSRDALAAADTLRFRVLRNGATTTMTFTQTPTVGLVVIADAPNSRYIESAIARHTEDGGPRVLEIGVPAVGATATPSTITLAASVPAPTASGGGTTSPNTLQFLVVTPAPVSSGGATTAPATIARTVVTPAPTAVTGSAVATPATVALLAITPAPSSSTGGTATPSVVALTVVVPAPTVILGATATPAAIALTVVIPAPLLGSGATATPAAIARTVTMPAPTASGGGTANPAAITRTVVTPAPTVVTGGTALPTTVALTVALPAPAMAAGAIATPTAVAITVVVPAPTSLAGATATPATIVRTVVTPSPTAVTGGAIATPAAIALLVTLPTPSSATGGTANPATIVRSVVVPAPTIVLGATATPAAIALTVSVPAPALGSGATATPAAITRTVVVPAPTVATGGTATPAAVALTVTVPAPSMGSGVTATPATITPVLTIPSVTVVVNATATPAAIALTAVVPAPTSATGGARVTPGTVALLITVPAPSVAGGASSTASPATITLLVTVPAPTTRGDALVTAQPIPLTVVVPTPAISTAPPKPQPAGTTTIIGCRQAETTFPRIASRQGTLRLLKVRQADIRFAVL